MWSINVNGLMGWLTAITFCYCIADIDEGRTWYSDNPGFVRVTNIGQSVVLQTPTGHPFIQVFYNVTRSLPATSAMVSIIILMAIFSCVTIMASASRQMFAFARDDGLPFSTWLSQVSAISRH